jgi:hypothetical protein
VTSETEEYKAAAKRFHDSIVDDLTKEARLTALLQDGDGTLTEWRENEPEDAAEAEALAKTLGFDIPHTDDYVWQAANAFQEFLWETGGYGADVYTTVRVTLAGGGPAGWIEFTVNQDGDLRGARVGYVDWFQLPVEFDLDDDTAEFAFSRYSADVIAEH